MPVRTVVLTLIAGSACSAFLLLLPTAALQAPDEALDPVRALPVAMQSAPDRIVIAAEDELVPVEVATVGVDLRSGTPLALLRDAQWARVIPIWIGEAEAAAIARALQGVEVPRPMTHDLLLATIRQLGGEIEEVLVPGVLGSTYLGLVRVRVGESSDSRVVELDARPSDALALAVRTDAPIRVAAFMLEEESDVEFLALEGLSEVVRMLGITVGGTTPELREELDLPDRPGMVVLQTHSSLGDQVRRGDLVVDVNGEVPSNARAYIRALQEGDPSSPIRIVITRDGEDSLVEVPRASQAGPQRQTSRES